MAIAGRYSPKVILPYLENHLSMVIIVMQPNRTKGNAHFKIRRLRQKFSLAVDNENKKFLSVIKMRPLTYSAFLTGTPLY
jgi:hypothetical protein